mmetsp:Transcript_18498/g.53346  ORF Transcript_18498/g.53346 Transcript_18498/m.53346 type:complete len:317 (-) Transcript_18498:523-1473(-)
MCILVKNASVHCKKRTVPISDHLGPLLRRIPPPSIRRIFRPGQISVHLHLVRYLRQQRRRIPLVGYIPLGLPGAMIRVVRVRVRVRVSHRHRIRTAPIRLKGVVVPSPLEYPSHVHRPGVRREHRRGTHRRVAQYQRRRAEQYVQDGLVRFADADDYADRRIAAFASSSSAVVIVVGRRPVVILQGSQDGIPPIGRHHRHDFGAGMPYRPHVKIQGRLTLEVGRYVPPEQILPPQVRHRPHLGQGGGARTAAVRSGAHAPVGRHGPFGLHPRVVEKVRRGGKGEEDVIPAAVPIRTQRIVAEFLLLLLPPRGGMRG